MEPRMKNPAAVIPGAWQAVVELNKASDSGGVPSSTLELVHLRVSQVNGCSACVDSGVKAAIKSGESAERIGTVAAWREAPYFTDAERAALASPRRPPGSLTPPTRCLTRSGTRRRSTSTSRAWRRSCSRSR
jgi:AhpD family alkylhydroperoxidase